MSDFGDLANNPQVKKYGIYVAVGLVALYFFYSYMSGSSTSSGTSSTTALDVPPNAAALDAASIQAQSQLQLAGLASQTSLGLAQINAQSTNYQYGTLAGLQAYSQNIGAAETVANTAIAATSNQNITGYNALASGFSNYVVGSANEIATAAAATSNIAASNNNTGSQVAGDLQAVASIIAAAEGGGAFSFGNNYGGAAFNTMQGLQTIPVVVGQPNTVYAGAGAAQPVITSGSGG